MFSPLLLLLALTGAARTDPTPPTLTYLFTANVTLAAPINVGRGPQGQRTVIPITGGVFSGPKVSGKVLNVGADWGWVDVNNNLTFHPDTRYQLQTDDGANIFVQTNGPAQGDGTIHLRETFETGSTEYYWLNNIVAVGVLRAGAGWVNIDSYYLTSSK